MEKIKLIQVDEAEGTVKKIYDEMEKVRGKDKVSNLFKAYANHPQIARANWNRMKIIMGGGCLSKKMKETIAVNLAVINECNYWISFHSYALREEGATQDEIEAAQSLNNDHVNLSEKEKRLVEFALKAQKDPHSISEEDMKVLKKQNVTDEEIVEILEAVNLSDGINRFCDALGLSKDPWLTD